MLTADSSALMLPRLIVILSTFVTLSINSAKDLMRWAEMLRCAQHDKEEPPIQTYACYNKPGSDIKRRTTWVLSIAGAQ